MKTTEVRKKLKIIKSLMSDWSTLDALLKSSKKCKADGLEISDEIIANVQKRMDVISLEFDKYLK